MPGLSTYLAVGLGGFLGANARFLLNRWVTDRCAAGFPYGILIVNAVGCFILGLFGTLAERLTWNESVRLLVAVGFVGAFTTFSTFEYDTFVLVNAGAYARAGMNIMGSVLVGFLAVCAGVAIGRLAVRGHP